MTETTNSAETDAPGLEFAKTEITIRYTNYRNETSIRKIAPISLWRGTTEWHPRIGWFLRARELERDVIRDFALEDVTITEM